MPIDNEKISLFAKITAIKVKEVECTCMQCSKVWHFNASDIQKEVLMNFNAIMRKRMRAGKDFGKCTKCGSHKIKKKEVTYYVDKKGNYLGQ